MRSRDASGMTAEALRSRDAALRADSGRELAGLHRASHERTDGMQSAAWRVSRAA